MTNGPAGHDNNAQSRTRDLTYSGTQLIEKWPSWKTKMARHQAHFSRCDGPWHE